MPPKPGGISYFNVNQYFICGLPVGCYLPGPGEPVQEPERVPALKELAVAAEPQADTDNQANTAA